MCGVETHRTLNMPFYLKVYDEGPLAFNFDQFRTNFHSRIYPFLFSFSFENVIIIHLYHAHLSLHEMK